MSVSGFVNAHCLEGWCQWRQQYQTAGHPHGRTHGEESIAKQTVSKMEENDEWEERKATTITSMRVLKEPV